MTTIADYELIETIAAGNHGEYHLAAPPPRLGRDGHVGVKVLARNATDADFERFARELRALAAVTSEHVVRPIEAGHQDGRLFYVTPHYDEGSLADAELPASAALDVLIDAARGAHDLHEVGVIHRDIKPSNILLEGGRGLVADLGLALVWEPGVTTTGVGPIGSVRYMEPDVIYGERAVRASDVWSLAISANEVLTGERCYDDVPDDSALAVFRHVLHNRPRLSDDLVPPVRAVLERALATERADRYSTAADFADALSTAGGSTS